LIADCRFFVPLYPGIYLWKPKSGHKGGIQRGIGTTGCGKRKVFIEICFSESPFGSPFAGKSGISSFDFEAKGDETTLNL
jgi:hypothetical protein